MNSSIPRLRLALRRRKLNANRLTSEVFGPDEPSTPEREVAGVPPLTERPRPEGPRPLPRPGLAAEMHGDDAAPELA